MCVNDRGEATTDAAAARVRMELATDGPGTDEDGVRAALGNATSRRDEQARIREALRTGRDEHGLPLTPARRAELERRRDEIGDVDSLLTATPGTGGALDEDSFLGRVQGDMDAGTLDTALADARVSAFTRAKQALLGTAGETGIDIDEDAVLRILRGIQGEVELAPGETLAALGADEVRSRRARSADEIRARLRRALAHVRVELDSELAARSHIDFTVNPDGSLQNLTLRFGPTTADGDLAAEVERVVVIERASRVLSRARAITSRAGHAEQEVIKIEQMIQDRLRQLRGPLSPQSRELVDSELDVLQANLDEFERVAASGDPALGSGRIGRPDAPPGYPEPPAGHYYRRRGDGWDLQLYPDTPEGTPRFTLEPDGSGGWRTVSRDAVAGAPAARFPEGTSAAQAFEQLTGPDSRSSFKQYWEMLRDNHLATREEVIAAMLAPGGRSEDSVRHALKESFRARVIDHTLRDLDGRVLTEAESMVRLRGLTEHLNSSDRGNLTEAWYARRHDGLIAHPEMSREANPGVVGREGRGVRAPDFLEGETLVELKSTSRGLGVEEVQQIEDDLLVCGSHNGSVSVAGVSHRVNGLRLVFSNIEGARGSAAQLAEWIRDSPFFTVEVFGSSGAATRINAATLPGLQRRAGVSNLAELLAVL